MVEFLKKHSNSEVHALVYANMTLIDGEGHSLGGTIGSKTRNGFVNKKSYFFSHNAYGCKLMINQKLFILPPDVDVESKGELILLHDIYYAKSAVLTGKILHINTALIDYRRHGGNVTAAQKYDFGTSIILKKLKNVDMLAKDHA